MLLEMIRKTIFLMRKTKNIIKINIQEFMQNLVQSD